MSGTKPVALLGTLLLIVPAAPAQRLPLPPDEQQAVNHAIDRGVAYLKQTQRKDGTWYKPNERGANIRHFLLKSYQSGYAALPGLTLLECGVPANDPIVQQAARFVRSKAAKMDLTYELSLSILFLDRLGDPKDKKIIQTFALRLIAGQSATGGWGYRCPLLSSPAQLELLTALRHLDGMPGIAEKPAKKPGAMAPIAQAPGAPKLEGTTAQPRSASLSVGIDLRSPGESSSLLGSIAEDNPEESTSLQGPIAKPLNRGHDCLGLAILDNKEPEYLEKDIAAPADPKPPQNEPVGKAGASDDKATQPKSPKPYVIPKRIAMLPVVQDPDLFVMQDPRGQSTEPLLPTTDNSNTQFAILALWRAQQYEVPVKRSLNLIVRRFLTSQNADGSWGYHYLFGGGENTRTLTMTCVGLIGLAVGHGLAQPRRAVQPAQDPRIVNGLIALSGNVGQPVEQRGMLDMQNLYFLWSLERVAVLYNLPTIGDKDWYRWGAQVLIRNQASAGNWANGLYVGSSPPLDTCLALLFLKRANLVKDLTAKLPFKAADLNFSIMEKLGPLPKPTEPQETPKQTKKKLPAVEPPKPAEPEKSTPIVKPPPSHEDTMPASESSGSKKKWFILSAIFFVIFSGGSLFFILLAINRRKEADEDAKPNKRKKRKTLTTDNTDNTDK
jgi:hypothetical protein